MPHIKIIKKKYTNYIAYPKNIPEARIIKDNDIPDKPVEYDIKYNRKGYVIRDTEVINIPYWMWLFCRIWHPDYLPWERSEWIYNTFYKKDKK